MHRKMDATENQNTSPVLSRRDIAALESAARDAALRPNTAKSYAVESRRFALYAAAAAADPENLSADEILRGYALARAAGEIHLPSARLPAFTPATFRAAAAALKSEGKQIPPALQKHLLAAMQKTAAAPRRARPLSPEEVVAMAKVRASSGEAAAARDACMLLLAHIFALRVSNLQAARVADLQVGPRSLEFFVRADKGNAAGAHRPLFGRTEENAAVFDSAMAAAVRWLSARQSYSGDALFCVLRGRAGGGAIAKGHTITLMLRRAAEQSGLSPDAVARLTVHSLRRGRLQEFDTAGMPLGVAMQHSGHKSINGLAPYLRR